MRTKLTKPFHQGSKYKKLTIETEEIQAYYGLQKDNKPRYKKKMSDEE